MVVLRLPSTARRLAVLLVARVAGTLAQSPVEISPFGEHGDLRVQLMGRYEVSGSPDQVISFDAPSFEIAFTVSNATVINITLQQQYISPAVAEGRPAEERPAATGIPDCADTGFQVHTFTVYVDGTAQGPATPDASCTFCTFDTGMFADDVQNPHQYPVATGLDPTQSHEIRIIKDSEADFNNCKMTYENYVTFSKINILGPGGAGMVAPPRTANYRRPKIEFIGDSKMTGMCNLCHEPSSDSDPMSVFGSSASEAWPKKMCDKLDADCHMSTWGGLGLLNLHDEVLDLATLWRREVMTNQSSVRKEWRADVVVINLGIDDDLDVGEMTDDVPAFWEHKKEVLLNFTVEVFKAHNFNTVILLACLPAFPTSGDVFCRQLADVVATARGPPHNVWHAAVFDARGFLTNDNQCCGLPDKGASVILADQAISACNRERGNTCVHSRAPPPPPSTSPSTPLRWDQVNPPLVSFIFVGVGVVLLSVCALCVGGVPDMPCKKKVDPATEPLAAGA